jgi:hypothetical protein
MKKLLLVGLLLVLVACQMPIESGTWDVDKPTSVAPTATPIQVIHQFHHFTVVRGGPGEGTPMPTATLMPSGGPGSVDPYPPPVPYPFP